MLDADAAAQPWERAASRRLLDLVPLAVGPDSGNPCHWLLGRLDHQPDEDVDAAAWLVAEAIMRLRTRGATANFDLWRTAATGGGRLSVEDRGRVEPFIETVFGTPEDPAPDDHAEGYVAEVVWYLLTRDVDQVGRTLRHIEEPSFYVTGRGGDGLAIFERDDGTLIFRLWEIKKHTGNRHLSSTASRAMSQLAAQGASYLAQYVAVASHNDPDLGGVYARLVDDWVDARPNAGAGIGLGTSLTLAPKRRCFSGMQPHFPNLSVGDQLEGLVVALADFGRVTQRVREFVWSAL